MLNVMFVLNVLACYVQLSGQTNGLFSKS